MMLSTLKIISAASLADMRAHSFTLKHSLIPNLLMSPISPLFISRNSNKFFLCTNSSNFASVINFNLQSLDEFSRVITYKIIQFQTILPPLSARMVGSCLKALANASMAKACFPLVDLARVSQAMDILISVCPPPYTTLLLLTV